MGNVVPSISGPFELIFEWPAIIVQCRLCDWRHVSSPRSKWGFWFGPPRMDRIELAARQARDQADAHAQEKHNDALKKYDDTQRHLEKTVPRVLAGKAPHDLADLRAEMERNRDFTLSFMDTERRCDICGRKEIDCTRDAMNRNIERAIANGKRMGLT